ncbi:PGF-pre-PGF domain-containing protein [Halorubrum distributum]|uniref:PGF-pre-PGF domain-containing protein n=1 Tax=Halorubrum distributum TaxID=29283 RepID=UPI002953F195|nr:PGF-pre-PGF domain-containing protein [Halorubrum distributum]MDV7351042.1 PGF-pre-PGF domain-containing protein [Halorubrum distributum]
MRWQRGSTTLLITISLGAVVLLVVSSGAVVLDRPSDPLNDEVALQPGDNPYAYLDDNDELAVDITEDNPNLDNEGVNPDGFAAQESLFYITYDGNESAEAWIDHEGTGVTFVVDGEPIESESNAVRLTSENDAVPVGIKVDTRVAEVTPGDRLIDEISVHARPANSEAIEDTDNDDNSDDDDDPGTVTTVGSPDATTRNVEILSLAAEVETEVDLRQLHVGDPAVRLTNLTFVSTDSGDVEFEVRGTTDPPPETSSVPLGVDPLGYYTVEFTTPDQPISEATTELVVDRDYLAETDVDPEQLAVYRETEAGWKQTKTTVVNTNDETVRLRVASTGFSAFAVAAERPALVPAETTLSTDQVAAGETLTVTVNLDNNGRAPANDVKVQIVTADERELVSDEAATVNAEVGETTTESIVVRLNSTGEYNLVLTGPALAAGSGSSGTGTDQLITQSVTVTEQLDDETGTEAEGASSINTPNEDSANTSVSGETEVRNDGEEVVTEPSGIDLTDLGGIALLIGIVLTTLLLFRRVPR